MIVRILRAGVMSLGLVAAVAVGVNPAAAEPVDGCPPGFGDPGAATLAEGLLQPRIVHGLTTSVYTVEELTEQFDELDANDDGSICLKAVSNLRGQSVKSWAAFYLADDNDHPVK